MADELAQDPKLNDAATMVLKARQSWEAAHPIGAPNDPYAGTSIPRAYEEGKVREATGSKYGIGDVDTYLSKTVMPNATSGRSQMRQAAASATFGIAPLIERALAPENASRSRLESAALETASPGPAFLEQTLPGLATSMGLPTGSAARGILPMLGRTGVAGMYGTGMAAAHVAGQAPTGQAPAALQQSIPQIAATGGLSAAIPGAIEGLNQIAPRIGLMDPFQRMANYMNRDYLPQIGPQGTAESGAKQILANRTAMAPPPNAAGPMTTAQPMMAEAMGGPGTAAWRQAISNSPALRGIAEGSPLIKGRALPPTDPDYVADLPGGIRQALRAWADPTYAKLRAQNPTLGGGSGGVTYAHAMSTPIGSPERQAVDAAMAAGWKAPEMRKWISTVVPGTGSGGGLDGVAQMYEEVLGKQPPIRADDFDNWFRVKRGLDDKITQMRKGNISLTTNYGWKEVAGLRDALDKELQNAVPEYQDTQAEYGARALLAKQVAKQAGSVGLPKAEEAPMPGTSGIGSWLYRIGLPAAKHVIGAARENTMTQLARVLSSRGDETERLLQEILAKQPGRPPSLPPGAFGQGANIAAMMGQQP